MPPVGFEPTILAGERLQTYALDRAATGNGIESLKKRFHKGVNQCIKIDKYIDCLLTFPC